MSWNPLNWVIWRESDEGVFTTSKSEWTLRGKSKRTTLTGIGSKLVAGLFGVVAGVTRVLVWLGRLVAVVTLAVARNVQRAVPGEDRKRLPPGRD